MQPCGARLFDLEAGKYAELDVKRSGEVILEQSHGWESIRQGQGIMSRPSVAEAEAKERKPGRSRDKAEAEEVTKGMAPQIPKGLDKCPIRQILD